jgi:nitrite reductase/ring-hydroxylating ferredoxin subunit
MTAAVRHDPQQDRAPEAGHTPAPTAAAPVAHRLGPLDRVPLGEGRAYALGGEQIAVFRTRGGGLHAVSAVCPHAGGPLADGQIDGTVVVCPLHLNVFELATGCSRTGQQPLQVYPVEVNGSGELVVWLPADGDR